MSSRRSGWTTLGDGVRQATQIMVGHKMRSFLLIVGVAIGVATLLAIVTIVTGLSGKIRHDIVSSYKPYIYVSRFSGMGGEDVSRLARRPQLMPECVDALEALDSVGAVDYYVSNNDATILHNGKERTKFVQVFGASQNFPLLFSFTLADGRFFTESEVASRSRVCVLGYGPRSDLYPRQDPIGQWLRIEGQSYEIVGTMEPRESFIGQLGDNWVVVPWTSYERDYLNPALEDRTLAASVADGFSVDEAEADIVGAMRKVRRLSPREPDDFAVTASETYGEMVDKITGGIALILVVLSSIGLMVGGIGVMNIMLISVTERTREIGVRMALGARRQDVLWQVLVEAGTLTGVGGLVGVGLGYGLSFLATKALKFPFTFSPLVVTLAVLFSVAIGLVFGLFPANRAARMDPVEALRSE